jgi:hypothetical protein
MNYHGRLLSPKHKQILGEQGATTAENQSVHVLQYCKPRLQSCSAYSQDGQQADNSQEEVNDDADTPWAALLHNSTCMQGVKKQFPNSDVVRAQKARQHVLQAR